MIENSSENFWGFFFVLNFLSLYSIIQSIKQKKMKNNIVAFHIGRGGKFNNSGYISYIGEKNFQDLINLNSDNIFITNRDTKGRFCKPYIIDDSGNSITDDDINGDIGMLNFDEDYDTYYCKYIENCTDIELKRIAESDVYKSYEIIEYLKS